MKKYSLPFSSVNSLDNSRNVQKGFVLIAALIFLLVLSIFSVAMFRGFGFQDKIAGNIREKERAFHAAESNLEFAEWWLIQGAADTGAACSGLLNANAGETKVCSNALANPINVPWKVGTVDIGFTYLPPTTPAMVINTAGGSNTYYAAPRFYIFYLGIDPTGQYMLYQVTASGYGGNSSSIAVVQSTYAVTTGVKDLGDL